MLAKCLAVGYRKGSFSKTQHCKKGTKTRHDKLGNVHSPAGGGYEDHCKKSQLILYLEVDNNNSYSYIDSYFKYSVGSLTEKRRDKITSAMPETVEVDEFSKRNGEPFYVVSEADLDSWLSRTGL